LTSAESPCTGRKRFVVGYLATNIVLSRSKAFMKYGSVGLELFLSVLMGLYAGRWLDTKLGTRGGFALFGFVIGIVTGFRFLWRAAKKAEREAKTPSTDDERPQLRRA
jgi:F0F1-type ATP synthase assembly protein I